MRLNNRIIARLELPAGKSDVIFFDDDLAGFGYRLRRSGDRVLASWVCQYRAHGRSRRALIGSAQALGTEQARSQAKKLLGAVALGRDPQADVGARGRRRVAVIDNDQRAPGAREAQAR
ncbi:MAG TPA: Arm DNA-binding domain-containing protein, partial [Xanthobacteraceae bacterium]